MSYIYDAFISYRHNELDKFVAENLHRQLEAFKLPKNLAKNENLKKKKIERVFRDRDELPLASNLEDPIVEALKSSEYLIVICSPRLKESIWCQKEIQTFIELHGRQRVFAVLVEGEPEDSFPKELLTDENGNLIEPLAADVRGKNKAEVKKLIKEEMLRLLAPMFGVGYDDLRQRHKEQQMKKTAGIVTACGAVGVAFGLVCAFSAININAQKKIIEEQNISLACSQAEGLSKEALEYYEKDDRHSAVETAYQAMTEYEGVKMPKSAYSERTLAKVMSIYEGGSYIKAASQIETPGVVKDIKSSPSGEYILTADNMGNLIAWDIVNQKDVFSVNEEFDIRIFDFIDDDRFYFVTTAGGLQVGSISDKSLKGDKVAIEDSFAVVNDAKLCSDGETIAELKFNTIDFLNKDTLESNASFALNEGSVFSKLFVASDSENVYACGIDANDKKFVVGVNSKTGEKLFETELINYDIVDGYVCDKYVYILSNDPMYEKASGTSNLTAVDIATGEIKFNTKIDDCLALNLYFSEANGKSTVATTCYSQINILDGETGEIRKTVFNDSNFSLVTPSGNGGYFFYQTDGLCRSLDADNDFSDLSFQTMICSDVLQFEKTAGGLIGRRTGDNRLIQYGYLKNKDFYEYEEETKKEPVEEALIGDAAAAWGKEKGIENASFINYALNMEGADFYIVSYMDNTVKVYNKKDLTVIEKYDGTILAPQKYYGQVKDYLLVEGLSEGYLFDKEGGLRAVIPEFYGLSNDGKAVVVDGRNMDAERCEIAIPIYDQSELLKRAKEYLDR